MKTTAILSQFTFAFLLVTLSQAESTIQYNLFLYTAGMNSTYLMPLQNGTRICPHDYNSSITIRCESQSIGETAEFKINGESVRNESVTPFYLIGDYEGVANPWLNYPTDAVVECFIEPSNEHYSVAISFDCDMFPDPAPMSILSSRGALSFVPSGTDSNLSVPITSGMTFCPDAAFGESEFSVSCAPSTSAKRVIFGVDGKVVQIDWKTPYLISGETIGNAAIPLPWDTYPMTSFNITCELDDGTLEVASEVGVYCDTDELRLEESPAPFPSPMEGEEPPSGCVFMNAASVQISDGWVPLVDGLVFKPYDDSRKISQAGVAPLVFNFVPAETSRYAIVLDMTTNGGSDHNDVWMSFTPGGFQIMKEGVSKRQDGWIKGYHNKNGRAAIVSTVDRNAHSISTGDVLTAGAEYEFTVSGRSSKVVLHQVLLFPCEGLGCHRSGWRGMQNSCIPDSI